MPKGEIHVQLFVDYADDTKLADVSRSARLLWIDALCLTKRLMTDGVVSERQIARLVLPERDAVARKLTAELLGSGGFIPDPKGYYVSGYLKRNKSKSEIVADRLAAQEAADKGNHKRWHIDKNEPSPTCRFCIGEASGNPSGTGSPPRSDTPSPPANPPLSPEIETETETEIVTNDRQGDPPVNKRKPKTPAPDIFPITASMRSWAETKAPGVDLESETERFLSSHSSKGNSFVNWTAAWHTWMASPYPKVMLSDETPTRQRRSDNDRMFG